MESFTERYDYSVGDHFVVLDYKDPALVSYEGPRTPLVDGPVEIALTDAEALAAQLDEDLEHTSLLVRSIDRCRRNACTCQTISSGVVLRSFIRRVNVCVEAAGWVRADVPCPHYQNDHVNTVAEAAQTRSRTSTSRYEYDEATQFVRVTHDGQTTVWRPIDQAREELLSVWTNAEDAALALGWSTRQALTAVAMFWADVYPDLPVDGPKTQLRAYAEVVEVLGTDVRVHEDFEQLLGGSYAGDPVALALAVRAARGSGPA